MTLKETTSFMALRKDSQKVKSGYAQTFNEFLDNSTIHGLRYFNQRGLSVLERLFFVSTFVVVVAWSIYFVIMVAEKWSLSPTIISINSEPKFSTDDPYPALTICNMNIALKTRVEKYSIYSKEYAMLHSFCKKESNITLLKSIEDWTLINELIMNNSQPCDKMLLQCSFGGVEYNCTDLFHPVIMDEGLCCTFNYLDPVYRLVNTSTKLDFNISYPPNFKPVDWNVETGYQSPLPKDFTPMKAVGLGQSLGLNIVLDIESGEYFCASGKSVGFKFQVHNPEEEPNIRQKGLLLSAGFESYVRIIPNKLDADQKLHSLSRKSRNCIFEGELNLNVFSHYSYENCMYECKTEVTLQRCGCVAPHMITQYSNRTICGYKDLDCMDRIDYFMKNKRDEYDCIQKCFLSCCSKKYKVDIFSAKIQKSFMDADIPIIANMSNTYVNDNIAVVKFYLKHHTYESIKQSPYIDEINVLSSIGGIICVFFGFSCISLIEIIYYICVRSWWSNYARNNEGFWRRRHVLPSNSSKICFVKPYKNQINSLKQ